MSIWIPARHLLEIWFLESASMPWCWVFVTKMFFIFFYSPSSPLKKYELLMDQNVFSHFIKLLSFREFEACLENTIPHLHAKFSLDLLWAVWFWRFYKRQVHSSSWNTWKDAGNRSNWTVEVRFFVVSLDIFSVLANFNEQEVSTEISSSELPKKCIRFKTTPPILQIHSCRLNYEQVITISRNFPCHLLILRKKSLFSIIQERCYSPRSIVTDIALVFSLTWKIESHASNWNGIVGIRMNH